MSVFDVATPSGTDPASQGDDRIRELKTALQDALRGEDTEGNEAIFPGSAPSTAPVFRYRGLRGGTGTRPASGQYGLFFDTTRQVLQRDNGSSWDDIGTVIPAGTVMVFYQAAAPTGWTKVVTQNDRALRVVSGTGGGTGGATGLSTGITHVVSAHTHSIPDQSHFHTLSVVSSHSGVNYSAGGEIGAPDQNQALRYVNAGGGETIFFRASATDSKLSTATSGVASANGTDTVTLAYADVLFCSKD